MLIGFLVVLCAFAPNIAWLAFYVREDAHPEPKPLLVVAFVLGILSVGGVYLLQYHAVPLLSRALEAPEKVILGSYAFIICAALIEEAVKFAAAGLFLRRNPAFEEPIDAMVYLVVVGLGFAFAENLLYLRNFSDTAFGVVNLAMMRFVSANLLHAVCSGTAGYFWAKGIVRKRPWRGALLGIATAGLIHVLYNVLTLAFHNQHPLLVNLPVLFILVMGMIELRDFEKLRALSQPLTLAVYEAPPRP